MAGGKLTDKAIKNAKPGERLTILSDGGGLQLWLTPAGGKLWNYAYRFGGKRRKLANRTVRQGACRHSIGSGEKAKGRGG